MTNEVDNRPIVTESDWTVASVESMPSINSIDLFKASQPFDRINRPIASSTDFDSMNIGSLEIHESEAQKIADDYVLVPYRGANILVPPEWLNPHNPDYIYRDPPPLPEPEPEDRKEPEPEDRKEPEPAGKPADVAIAWDNVSSMRQGVMPLNTGDTLTRVNGTETLTTPDGDVVVFSGNHQAVMSNKAQIEMLNQKTGKFEKVAQLPGEFGTEINTSLRITLANGTVVTAAVAAGESSITSVQHRDKATQFTTWSSKSR